MSHIDEPQGCQMRENKAPTSSRMYSMSSMLQSEMRSAASCCTSLS